MTVESVAPPDRCVCVTYGIDLNGCIVPDSQAKAGLSTGKKNEYNKRDTSILQRRCGPVTVVNKFT